MGVTELKIHTWPSKILRKKCKLVDKVDKRIKDLFEQLYLLMKNHQGVGIAANQAGLDLSLIVIEAEDKVFKLANPRIIKKEGKIEIEEGCLSFPGLILRIKRARKVWVDALDDKGHPLSIEAEGLLSVIFQHEIDHINGVVFVDRLPLRERIRIFSQLNKLTKSGLS
ncbi:MAG: peptide deformylase [Candidatus Omnitrophota bacterium]|nr:MAG: peptide deformylase [Candidatus Omnitrophota bacterium]HDN86053.1 peptide deformylase [Candidatus Omnitrophota bacterium]